jgi:hypothetical protein
MGEKVDHIRTDGSAIDGTDGAGASRIGGSDCDREATDGTDGAGAKGGSMAA